MPKPSRDPLLSPNSADQSEAPVPSPHSARVPRVRAKSRDAGDKGADAATPEEIQKLARRSHLKRELGGIALLLATVFIAGSLLAGGTSGSCTAAGGIFGPVGACLRSSVLIALGALAAVVVPFIPAVHALRLLGRIQEREDRRLLFFTIGLAAIVPIAAALARGATVDASQIDFYAGLVGSFIAFYLVKAVGLGGAWVFVAIAGCGLMAGTLGWNPLRILIGNRAHRADGGQRLAEDQSANATAVASTAELLTKAERLEPSASEDLVGSRVTDAGTPAGRRSGGPSR